MNTSTQQNWIAVASAEHVGIGRVQGFMQVCHGKAAPLRRVLPGSRVVYYSPAAHLAARTSCKPLPRSVW